MGQQPPHQTNKQPLSNKNKQPIPLEKHNPYPCTDTTRTIHIYNDSYLTSNPPPPTPPKINNSQKSQNPKSRVGEDFKKIIKLFEDKKVLKQEESKEKFKALGNSFTLNHNC